jgi:putative Mn2+ efflux pump MntP
MGVDARRRPSGAGIALNILQFVNDSTQLVSAIISIAISVAILWYLFQPHVKAAFGRS